MKHVVFQWRVFLFCGFSVATGIVATLWMRSDSHGSVSTIAAARQVSMLLAQADENAQAHDDTFPADRVVGHAQCVDCHRAEYLHWKGTPHATKVFDMLRLDEDSLKYAEAMGIAPDKITKSSICVDCHGTPQIDGKGHRRSIAGVSCESCHNPSGGKDGWLNAHAVYGPTGTRREDETQQHYQDRASRCRKAGQLRSTDSYDLVRRCYECHVVGNEDLVNRAQHKSADGEFAFPDDLLRKSIRHNFHLDQRTNVEVSTLWTDPLRNGEGRQAAGRKRMMFVIGGMADLEISLRNLARATDPDGDFFSGMSDRISDAYDLLSEDVLDTVETELPNVKAAVDAAKEIYTKLDDDEYSIENDKAATIEAAAAVAEAGRQFAAAHDGSKLTDLDEPETPEDAEE